MHRKYFMFLAAASVSAFATCAMAAGTLDLAVRGRAPEYAILRAADASPSVVYAAEELREHVKRMTDVELPIMADDQPQPPAKAIVLGRTKYTIPLNVQQELGDDGFYLKTRGPHLLVVGSDVRGVLYGVYELLERFGGCRWYASWHTVVPKRDAFSVPDDLSDIQRPAFPCRDALWFDCRNGDFAARNRGNGIGHGQQERHGGNTWRFGGGLGNCHTFNTLLPPEKYFDAHPEYFSFVKGRRLKERTQLCLTNPDVLRIVTSNVLARIRKDPDAKFYGVSQNDWYNFCTCPKCAAVDAEEGSHAGTMIRFVNAIAEAVEREFPGKCIETLAYQYTRKPPKKTKLRHNVIPCLCSIECDFSRPLDKSPYKQNVSFVKDLEGWNKLTDWLYVWDYTTDFLCYPHPFPNVYTLQENVKFFRNHGVKMLFEQGGCQGRHAGFAELKAWLLLKWMWNPELPAEPLIADFINGYYGKGAPFVRAVFDEAHRREAAYFKANPSRRLSIYQHVASKECRESLDDEFVAWAQAQMKKAVEAVAGDPPVYSYNVRMTALSFDYMRLERLWSELPPNTAPSPEMQRLAQSLLARLDEAKDIRISNSTVNRRHVPIVRGWRKLAKGEYAARPK